MTQLEIARNLLKERRKEMRNMKPNHKFHNEDTYSHSISVVQHSSKLAYQLDLSDDAEDQLRTACYAHDLGKVETWNPEGSPWFRGHEEVSADILVANGFDPDDDIVNAVRYHGRLQQFDKMSDKARRKLVNKISNLKLFIMLQLCDAEGFSDYGRTQALKQLKEFVDFVCDNVVFNVDNTYPVWLQIIIDEILPANMTDAFGTPNAFGDHNDE
jgi:putative nucleotidyltransferase with HDIG domain